MLNVSILNDKLKDFNYYVRKLPMFLQQSEGFIEHYRIWYDMLVGDLETKINNTGVVGVADTLFNLLNIFDQTIDNNGNIIDNYLKFISDLGEQSRAEYEDYELDKDYVSDILDKIGSLFGVRRSFELTYTNANGTQRKYVELNNRDFLILIKAQIVKNYCDGTYEQIKQYYESVGLYVYVTTATIPATSDVYLVNFSGSTAYSPSENVQAMFFAGLLTIQSMGIAYRHAYVSLDRILIWDGFDNTYGWGEDVEVMGQIMTDGGQWVL